MKFRSLHKWDNIATSYGLIYAAQLIDELLFEFTLDTYKPSAMNSCLLAKEAEAVIKSIEAGTIKKPNLKHVINELCDNLENDDVAQSLLSVDLSGIKAALKDPKSTDTSISATIDLLISQIPIQAYKLKNEEMLISEITGSQNPDKIRTLTRSYITTLLNFGFSARHLQEKSQNFFFYSPDRIHSNDAIQDYISIFNQDAEKFTLFYRAPKILNEFKAAGKRIGIEISNEIPEFSELLSLNGFKIAKDETYLKTETKNSKDPYTAKHIADMRIDQLQTLVGLYHHKKAPKKIIDCLIVNDNGNIKKTSSSTNPMHKCHDHKPSVAAKKLAEFMEAFSMRNESFKKFNRSAELHALALSSESKENQMINLWIALESLIPNKNIDSISQIEHVCDSILPFLNLGYINKLITRLLKDLLYWNSSLTKKNLKGIEGKDLSERLARLIALSEHNTEMNNLENSFNNFYLLTERFKYIKKLLSSPENVKGALDSHKTRVEWQIRRIYRARNTIVHDGVTPSYTSVLIENTHDYLDSIMNSLMKLASQKNTLDAIDQGFKMVDINYNAYYKNLSQKGLSFNKDNIHRLLFTHPI